MCDSERCPPGLQCKGNNIVVPVVANSTWLAEGGVYKLQTCPTGYSKISTEGEEDQQRCAPCAEGSECVLSECSVCVGCQAGKYKDTAGTQSCRACPENTFNPNLNAKDYASCR